MKTTSEAGFIPEALSVKKEVRLGYPEGYLHLVTRGQWTEHLLRTLSQLKMTVTVALKLKKATRRGRKI